MYLDVTSGLEFKSDYHYYENYLDNNVLDNSNSIVKILYDPTNSTHKMNILSVTGDNNSGKTDYGWEIFTIFNNLIS